MSDTIQLQFDPRLTKLLASGVTQPIHRTIVKIGTLVKNEAVKNLTKNKSMDQGALRQSIVFSDKVTWGTVVVGKKYGAVVENGRGKGKPMSSKYIEGWVVRKFGDPKLAFPIARSISKKGIKAKPFFKPAVKEGTRQADSIQKREIDNYLKSNLG